MFSPREIIEDIQKNKFGIGLQTDPKSEKVIEGLMRSLNSALEQLSEDLYSEQTHFVLELIQNADDNDYENGVTPFLKFRIDDEKILIQNNEKGFTEDNVRSVCDVGKSTKSKRLGYIGEKGIGFKSVFRISNTPQIFSNGFQFEFKRKDEQYKLGFVVPYWIEETPEFVDKKLTNIVLPLREDVREELSKFNEIEPTLLLFLRKLKIIEIHNITEGKINIVERKEKDGKVVITHSKGKEYYKLIRKTLTVPRDIQEQEEKRKGVEETILILAFPLTPDGLADATKEQKIFAYLPTRNYGFNFIIQADFLLPSSREDIHKDKSWNNWLRDNIASVFLEAVDEFKQDEKLKTTYYNYIPLANEVTDEFFSSVVNQIHNKLREYECILTESDNWCKPQEVFRADKEIRELIPNDDLKEFFGKEYISSDIKANKSTLDALKVSEFEFSHLAQCLQKTEWLKQQSDEWFIKLYSYLNSRNLGEEQLRELKELRILRLENDELASTIEKPVFFPLDKKGDYGFEKELRIIKRTIYEPKDREKKEAVGEFLKKIGVQDASPYEIIESHILPIYESGDDSSNWKSKDEKQLLGYIRYIKDNLQNYEKESEKRLNASENSWRKKDPLGRLKKSLYIRINKTVDGTNDYDHLENIYLPKIYGNENDLESLFDGIEGISFLHQEYIEDIIRKYRLEKRKVKKSKVDIQKKREAEIKDWREFFVKLGVNEIPRINIKEETKTHRTNSGKKYEQNFESYSSPDICNVLEKKDRERNKKLLIILDKYWNHYSKFTECRDYFFYRGWYFSVKKADWLQFITNNSWLPTSLNTLAKPSEVFLDKPEIRELLGDTVPYLTVELKNEKFVKELGINSEANVEAVLKYLNILTQQKCKDKTAFTKLYEFLNKNYENNKDIINTAFSNNRIIYLPNTAQSYFTRQEVLWEDVSDIFGENRGYLEKHYPKLKSFFVDKLGVNEKPKPKDYADVLIDISKKEKVEENDEKIILEIYKKLNYYLNPENNEHLISKEQWWNDFISKPIFWTYKEEFWKNDNDVFVNDNQEIYELFKDNPEISFLKLPENYHPKIQHFIEFTHISYLSKAVKMELVSKEIPEIEQDLTEQIQCFVPYILRYLYQSAYSDYERLKKDGTLSQLKNLTCYSLESLEVKYSLGSEFVFGKRGCFLYDRNLYIQKDKLEDTDHLAIELSKLFGEIGGFDNFLISLFDKKTDAKIENLLRAKGIQELPEEEKEWFRIAEADRRMAEEKEEMEITAEKQPSVSHQSETLTETPSVAPKEPDIFEEIEWQPECTPDEAVTYFKDVGEQFIEKTEPAPAKEKKQSSISPEPLKHPKEAERDVLSQKAKMKIGRWGEEYVFKLLKKELSAKYTKGKMEETSDGFTIRSDELLIVEVRWLNKEKERYGEYDIEVVENNIKEYIEVKSTKTRTKDWFDVSNVQWEKMKQEQDKFHIYRVYNAGTKDANLDVITNPYKMWQDGDLNAYPIRIQI
ncbi:MAG: DUF3883 domain-containing protein [Leptospiraceae bacterium]|nr:DUF3883 domain-containing protein [Leptospiraceae bacterium]